MPLLWLSIAFIAGIILAKNTTFTLPVWIVTAVLVTGFLLIERCKLKQSALWARVRSVMPVPFGLVVLVFALGGLRYFSALPRSDPSRLAYYNDRGTYTLTGVVSAPPDRREDAVYLEISMREIVDLQESDPSLAVKSIRGTARVRLPASAIWELGDVLRFNAKPVTPAEEGTFSYKDYLERQGIQSVIYFPQRVELIGKDEAGLLRPALETLRQKAQDTIFRQFPQPESGLLAGILLGLDANLPQTLKEAYQQTGTAHIIAISGFNMALLAGLFTALFTRISNRYWAAFLTFFVLAAYTIFVGASPSVVRAAVMAVAALGGHLIGRYKTALNSLGLTAALMCIVNPLIPGDVSFQLSFAATLGLVLFAGPLTDWMDCHFEKHFSEVQARNLSSFISEYLLFTLAAQVTTLPVIAYNFRRISVSSLIANPLILPVQPPILVLGGISTIAGMIFPWLGKLLALLVLMPMRYTNSVVEWLSKVKSAGFTVHPQAAVWILVIVAVLIMLFWFRDYFKKLFGKGFIWLVFILITACLAIWSVFDHLPDGSLHISFIRVEDTSAFILRDPQGKTLVFDPDESVNELSAEVSRDLSPWNFKIDEVWITDRASVKNLELLLERIPVTKSVLAPHVYLAGADQRPVQIPSEIEAVKLSPYEQVAYPSGLTIRIAAETADKAALFIEYGELRMLIPNGVDFAVIRETNPDLLDNLSFLVLREEDISYIPPRVWQALTAEVTLWNSPAVSPIEQWIGMDAHQRISISSDGAGFSIETD